MSERVLAARYADAFVAAAGDAAGESVAVFDRLAELYEASDTVRQLLVSPVIREEDRRRGIELIAGELGLPDRVRRLLEILVANGRGRLLPLLREAIAEAVDRRLGRKHLVIQTARPWSEVQKKQFIDSLGAADARVDWEIDEDLLGGVRVQADDLVWDGSVRRQLNRLQEILTR